MFCKNVSQYRDHDNHMNENDILGYNDKHMWIVLKFWEAISDMLLQPVLEWVQTHESDSSPSPQGVESLFTEYQVEVHGVLSPSPQGASLSPSPQGMSLSPRPRSTSPNPDSTTESDSGLTPTLATA